MTMALHDSRGLTEPADRHSRGTLKKILIVLALLVGALMATLLIWGAHRYQTLVSFGKQVQEKYQAVNRTYSFTPPPAGQSPAAERWAAMLRVRERMLGRVAPEFTQSVDGLLKARNLGKMSLAWDLISLSPHLRPVLDEQIAALHGEQMSLSEYQWLLGLAMRQAMADPARYEAGAGYWNVLKQSERLSRSDNDPANDISAERVFAFLQKTYDAYEISQSDVLERLRKPGATPYVVDWAVVAGRWISPLEIKPKGLPH